MHQRFQLEWNLFEPESLSPVLALPVKTILLHLLGQQARHLRILEFWLLLLMAVPALSVAIQLAPRLMVAPKSLQAPVSLKHQYHFATSISILSWSRPLAPAIGPNPSMLWLGRSFLFVH